MCKREQTLTIIGKFRPHGPKDNPCEMSGVFAPNPPQLPPEEPCNPTISPETSSASNGATVNVESATCTTPLDYTTTSETSTSPTTSEPNPTTDTLPGVEEYVEATQTAYLQPAP